MEIIPSEWYPVLGHENMVLHDQIFQELSDVITLKSLLIRLIR